MKPLQNEKAVAIVMLLLALPMLLLIFKTTLSLFSNIRSQQVARERCFSVSLAALRDNSPAASFISQLEVQLPKYAVTPVALPEAESPEANYAVRKMVFNLKNEVADFNCGAEAQWRDNLWHYQIVLDKL